MMIMKSLGEGGTSADWEQYIELLSQSGKFRGGSALGNGVCVNADDTTRECTASGFMKFEAASIDEVLALVAQNPVVKSGGEVEVLELSET